MNTLQQHSVWQKLIRKPSAILALSIIMLTILLAVFAYVLSPDASPNANRMIVELGAKKPGFTKKLLLLPKQKSNEKQSVFHELLMGKSDDFNFLPINSYSFTGENIVVHHFIDEGLEDTLQYPLNILLPTEEHNKTISAQQAFLEKERIKNHCFYLGSDRYGRDILSRLLIGARVSIAVGLVAVLLSLSIGVFLGAIAGYFGGWVDNLVMFVVNIFWSVPTLLLVFALTLTLGKGFWDIFVAIGLTMWVGAARLIRGQVLVLKEMDYIIAAKAIGASHARIIIKHILPNIAGPIIVVAASNFAAAILIEAGLSFLGIGIQPPQPSWGLMIKEHYNFLITNQPLAAIIPGIAIMVLVYAFNLLGNALRDVLDVRG
ncbi:MAG: ABC transporter permease [Phycisphaerales bacterium]|nr:ABC transporter permease [Phycisphaerales bacterium]